MIRSPSDDRRIRLPASTASLACVLVREARIGDLDAQRVGGRPDLSPEDVRPLPDDDEVEGASGD